MGWMGDINVFFSPPWWILSKKHFQLFLVKVWDNLFPPNLHLNAIRGQGKLVISWPRAIDQSQP